ncbi:BolA family protein [Aquibaculum arenosum]|uniref:BolA family transcriptional regulator n=1 Tax=Aquibaculum arenosum TaxID=3032591 RepID=A0ABT5YM88_9PROT|nr:BolA family protein [Fodinicurvata sp. CAU 1616]MDF2095875.1 BolA family transcriptional regulator [Fodinicurvata sp. CAU 1616]
MSMSQNLERKLREAFAPQELTIQDDSARHEGHAGARPGGETHYRVRIVSDRFVGLSRVERQRAVYAVLGAEFEAGLHALQMQTLTPEEAK